MSAFTTLFTAFILYNLGCALKEFINSFKEDTEYSGYYD